MRYLALGDSFRSLSQQFRVGLSTSRAIVKETCKSIIDVLGHLYIITPTDTKEWIKIARDFEKRLHFPHCVGAIDGKHVRIVCPRSSGSYFYNYKDFFSIILLGIVESHYKFIFIDVGSEGKASDGGVWSKCTFHHFLNTQNNTLNFPAAQKVTGFQQKLPFFFVADDAFPLGPHIMKPYPGGNLSKKQSVFNYRLSRTRRVVENSFGILTSRFRLLQRSIELNPNVCQEIVFAICIIHNYLQQNANNDYIRPNDVDVELDDGNIIPGNWRQEGQHLYPMARDTQRNASNYAKTVRDALCDYFLTQRGEISWQYDKAHL
jgi:hypothetical protein